jgi:hypothetical protein
MPHKIDWIDSGRWPSQPPDPAFPDGCVLDVSRGCQQTCRVDLPYPAKRIGQYIIVCERCGTNAMVTTAGRRDDPRSIRLACKQSQ